MRVLTSSKLPSHGDISLPDALDFPAYVVMHARLLSNMRGSSHQQSIFHYGSFSYWRDIPRGTIGSNIPPTSSRTIRQLTCRSMVCLAQISGFERNATRVFGTTHTIRQDIINTCSEYISNEYLAVEDDCFTGSFVDAFDIFSAGVVLTCLGRMSPSSDVPNAASALNKCTSLLTLLGERFSALKALCRVLWCLQESADMVSNNFWPKSIYDRRPAELTKKAQVIELPDIVPHALRVMIEGTFRGSRAVH